MFVSRSPLVHRKDRHLHFHLFQIWHIFKITFELENPILQTSHINSLRQNFIYRFVKTPLMKYDMTFEGMIQAHNGLTWIFCHFPQNYEQEAQGPHPSPVILAKIFHKNTCKITFLYCSPNSSGTMTLTTRLYNRSPFLAQGSLEKILTFHIETDVNMFYPNVECGPSRPPGTKISTHFNLHYQTCLSPLTDVLKIEASCQFFEHLVHKIKIYPLQYLRRIIIIEWLGSSVCRF